MKIRQL